MSEVNAQKFEARGAVISQDEVYRYLLWRRRPSRKGYVGFIMLNPSTADAESDDPTIIRCLRRALDMGYDGIEVCNLYAFRTTSPAELKEAGYPIGPENDDYLKRMGERCKMIICGWGNHAQQEQVGHVRDLIGQVNQNIYHLGITKAGQPRHPLYVGYAVEPRKFED